MWILAYKTAKNTNQFGVLGGLVLFIYGNRVPVLKKFLIFPHGATLAGAL